MWNNSSSCISLRTDLHTRQSGPIVAHPCPDKIGFSYLALSKQSVGLEEMEGPAEGAAVGLDVGEEDGADVGASVGGGV